MASVRAGRDARGAMNDLPIPGQPGSNVPDFDLNTMRSVQPAPDPSAMTRLPPAQPIPMLPSYANNPPPVDDMLNKIMTPAPAVFKQPAVQPTPQQPQVPDVGIPNTGIPTLKPGSDPAVTAPPVPTDNTARNAQVVRGRAGIDPSTADTGGFTRDTGIDWKKAAVALGIPLAVAAVLFGRRGRGGASAQELERALQAGGGEIAPDLGKAPYLDDTVANATDEARHRVNEAYGGDDASAIQSKQDAAGRQADINSGKIKPQDYAEGEKPKPGTEGYKQWFKYRQDLSKNKRGQGSSFGAKQ